MIKLFFALFVGYISLCAYLYFTQNKKIFNKKYATPYTPKITKIIYFKTDDGIKLEGGFTKNGQNLPLVLYFSGNANNVLEFLDKIAPKIKNYNFIGFNYPGYAKSAGKPSEKNILKYANEIYNKYKPDFVIGRSLGSAVASYLASKHNFKGLLLITPFDSIEHIAKIDYPYLPVKWLLKYKFKEIEFIKKSFVPTSIIAIKNDDVIPKECLDNLIKNIPNLKKIFWLKNIKHGEIYKYPKIDKIIKKGLDILWI